MNIPIDKQFTKGNDLWIHLYKPAANGGMLWGTFRDRMGVSTGIDMRFDLASLIETVDGLDNLSAPFSEDEINEVLKFLPTNRAPGPDGFTGLFVKRCWNIIKKDFFATFPGLL